MGTDSSMEVLLAGAGKAVPLRSEQVVIRGIAAARHQPDEFASVVPGPLDGVELVTHSDGGGLLQGARVVRHVFAPVLARPVVQTALILFNPTYL